MLVELNVVEQRYQAVLEVINDGATVTDVARRNGVSRQTVIAIEKGRFRPSVELALRMARALQTPLDRLFWLNEDEG